MLHCVRIMMATYNGERYLREQLDSIIRQSFVDWSLVIQDDGSKDGTWRILEEYSRRDNRITIRQSRERRHGAYYNFHSIANCEKESGVFYEYYMFSDQDDIWDADKIEKMVGCAAKQDGRKPYLLYGDMRVVDGDNEMIIPSVTRKQGLEYKNTMSLFMCHNIYGCNLLMNCEAFRLVPVIDTTLDIVEILCHDNLYAKFAGVMGKIEYLDSVLMSYRRHGGNVTAVQQYGFGISRIVNRLFKMDELARDHAKTYRQSLYAVELLRSNEQADRQTLDAVDACILCSGPRAVKNFIHYKIDCGNRIKNTSRCIVLFSGKHMKYL